jgi:meiotic recombination protein SPO11
MTIRISLCLGRRSAHCDISPFTICYCGRLSLRLGVRPSDLDKYKIPQQCRLEMTEHDIKTGKELLEEEFIQKNPDWMRELQIMVDSKEKAEIQSLSSFGFQYLSKVYLPLKLQAGGWI